jgi:capsular exopolysaccharide synthesis family protein
MLTGPEAMNIDVSSSPVKVELGPEPEHQTESRSPLRLYFSHMWRQRWIISAFTVAGIVICLYMISGLKPTYRASALLLLQGQEQNAIPTQMAVVPLEPPDLETVNAEIAVIKSRPFAEKIIDALKLETNPEFARKDEEPTIASMAIDWVRDSFSSFLDTVYSAFGLAAEEDFILNAAAAEAAKREQLIDSYLKRLEARPAGRSRLIEVAFTSNDPQLSATVANTLTDYYISEQVRAKVDVTEKTAKWLDDRLQTLRAEAEKTERQAEQYRSKSGLVRGEAGPLIVQEISKLSNDLSIARVARAEADARLQQAERAISGAGRGTTTDVLRSPLIQDLTRQLIGLKQQETNLLKSMGEKHPSVLAVRAQIDDMQIAIGQETRALLSGLRSEAAAARAREKTLSDQLDVLKTQTATVSQAEVQLRSYSADVDSSRALLNQLQTRFNEVVLQRDILQPDARLLAAATVPTLPNGPNKPLLLILATFFAAVVGVVVGMLREAMDGKVRSADQLTVATGVPMLGIVPLLPGRWRSRGAASRYILEHPASSYAEAINAILTAHLLRAARRSVVITVSSSLPGEGKSLFSLSLARAATNLGKRVLLIEADLRRPSLHEFIGTSAASGLSDVLNGQASLDDAIRYDPRSELQFLSCGSPVRNPLPLIGSRDFVNLLQTARRSFDLVIIDGPPLLPVPDGRILAANADETIFLAAWGRTPVSQALQALRILENSGANVRGVVVSQVNVRRHAEYGYSDSGQYHLGRAYYRN